MKKQTKLEFGKYYHIYNRGNNKEKIFNEDENYRYFMQLFMNYIIPISDLYTYCLLPNHFHFLLRIKREEELTNFSEKINKYRQKNIPWRFISQKFSNFFNSYAKSFNLVYNRYGSLFQERFGRIEVDSDEYYSELIYYIHFNPQKHGFVKDFREYPYSSYSEILSGTGTIVQREKVLSWFGGKDEFVKFHMDDHDQSDINNVIFE